MTKHYTLTTDTTRQIRLDGSGDYTVTLAAPGAKAEILGAFKLTGDEKLTVNLTVIHQAPHTVAHSTVRATADDHSRAIINGTILVRETAHGTDSFLSEHVLLLSPDATAEAVPNLEILTEDVTCSHAATIGQLDDEQLFYVMSRGVDRDSAKQLIADSFLAEVATRVKRS